MKKKKAKGKKKKKVRKKRAVVPAASSLPVARKNDALIDWNKERTNLLQKTICQGATDTELSFFLELCKATNLNPFLKEIWFIKTIDKKTSEEKLLIMAARDGYLQIANRHPMFDGMESGVVYKDGIIHYGWARVHRKDRKFPATFTAIFKEYNKDWHKAWKQTPSAMIQKVAEANALKRGFSITGLAIEEEIGTYIPKDSITYDSREGEKDITPKPEGKDEPKSDTPSPRDTKLKIMMETWKQLTALKPELYTDKKRLEFYGEHGATEESELNVQTIENLTRQFNTDLSELLKAKGEK